MKFYGWSPLWATWSIRRRADYQPLITPWLAGAETTSPISPLILDGISTQSPFPFFNEASQKRIFMAFILEGIWNNKGQSIVHQVGVSISNWVAFFCNSRLKHVYKGEKTTSGIGEGSIFGKFLSLMRLQIHTEYR